MSTAEIVKKVAEGMIVCIDEDVDAGSLEWNAHSAFKGVFLKHLVKGKSTDGRLSCHLVKVESGCEIGEHIHGDRWELHEVIGGSGKGILAEKEIPYKQGVSVVIPGGETQGYCRP